MISKNGKTPHEVASYRPRNIQFRKSNIKKAKYWRQKSNTRSSICISKRTFIDGYSKVHIAIKKAFEEKKLLIAFFSRFRTRI